jgi:hypothetical protein
MKDRKRKSRIAIEERNALYNKTIKHNQELALSNMLLSVKINKLENAIKQANKRVWWQPWKYLTPKIFIK